MLNIKIKIITIWKKDIKIYKFSHGMLKIRKISNFDF
jgi:hypothetical protein